MKSQPFVSSLSVVLAVGLSSAGIAAQNATPEPPSGPPGSVPIEPERPESEVREPPPPPPPSRPPVPRRPTAGRVEFIPSDPSLSLLTQSGVTPMTYGVYDYYWGYRALYGGYAPVFSPVCRGGCTVSMEPGTYDLALEKDGRVARAAPTFVPGNAKIHGNYVDRSGTRTTGVIVGVGGSIGGIVMMIASYHRHVDCDPNGVCFEHNSVNDALLGAGIGTLIGSVIVGSILGSIQDRAEITVTPLRLSSGPRFGGIVLDRGVMEGAALSIAF